MLKTNSLKIQMYMNVSTNIYKDKLQMIFTVNFIFKTNYRQCPPNTGSWHA